MQTRGRAPELEGRHPGELRGNARLGTQGTQVEGDKKSKARKTKKRYKENCSVFFSGFFISHL